MVQMPAFLAAIDVQGESAKALDVNVKWTQYFATGTSATTLGNNDNVRKIMLQQAFPPAVGTFNDSSKSDCLQNWLNSSSDNSKTLNAWWQTQQLPGLSNAIFLKENSAHLQQFIDAEKITCK